MSDIFKHVNMKLIEINKNISHYWIELGECLCRAYESRLDLLFEEVSF